MIYVLDLIGTGVFAISGALAASRKNMDIFGFCVLALMPAVGGGTVRDLVIGRTPVFWVEDYAYLLVAAAAAVATYFAAHLVKSRRNWLVWMDAVGLALFAVLGTRIALEMGTSTQVAVVMGVVTAVTGGMIRDIICNEIPLILSREIYATAAIAASLLYVGGLAAGLAPVPAAAAGIVAEFLVRGAAILRDLSLPAYRQR